MYAGYYPRRRPTDEVIEVVGLAEKRDVRVNKLSGGQQRRLDVAIAMAGDPELLFLDEPTTGFDPGRPPQRLGDRQEPLVDRQDGVPHDPLHGRGAEPREPRRGHRARHDRRRGSAGEPGRARTDEDEDPVPPAARSSRTRSRFPPSPDGSYEILADQEETTKLVHDLTAWALESGFVLDALEVTPPTLEDVYLELTASEDVTA